MTLPVILITGGTGQIGQALKNHTASNQYTILAPSRTMFDLTQSTTLAAALEQTKPSFIINAGAYTQVDLAENEIDIAFAVNANAPSAMAVWCGKNHVPMLHLSTDYVFNGHGQTPYHEDVEMDALSVYGASKSVGENAVRQHCPQHVILRTSWVFSPNGKNFVKTMLSLASRPSLDIVHDQTGCPTPADAIADAIWQIVDKALGGRRIWGTYHYCGKPTATWYDFAVEIFRQSLAQGLPAPTQLNPVTTADYPTAALRPAYSVLNCRKIYETLGITQPDWQAYLLPVLRQHNQG